ncbi:MAG: indole-3-acetate monooxygenase [Acetobacteraceae bacterium]|nr:indole-3-acetate monooxygenase [Acetobacteraceae bacterium]
MNEMSPSSKVVGLPRLVAAAQALEPLIRDYREPLAKGPDLPRPLADALKQAGLTQLWLPRALGGPETHPVEFVQVIETLARFDGAVAWCAMISSASSWLTGMMAAEAMRRLLPAGSMLAASGSGHPNGTATRDGEGWRVNGRWSWVSFSRHSTVSALMCVEQENGAARLTAEDSGSASPGAPVLRGVLLPSSMVQVLGNWNGSGLRSSGSHDVTCTDVWVPDDCTIQMGMPGAQVNPLYTLPMASAFAITVIGIPLGIAAAAVDALVHLAQTKVAFINSAPLCEQEAIQLEVAKAKTRLHAARAFAFEAIGSVWASASAGQPVSVEQQAQLRMACWNAGDAGKEVVERMYSAAGSTAVLEDAPFAAMLRDVHAACQHIQFASRLMVPPGRILLGLEPGTPMI